MASLQLTDVSKSYGGKSVLEPLDLDVPDGTFCCLLGSSGSGKSTLLRIVAGLTEPDSGTVRIAGDDVTATPIHRRRVGFVFQNYALFPHLSVAANVSFGLRARRMRRGAARKRVESMLELVGLSDYLASKPNQLSGGQQQRVALARALVTEPEVLLLDEPLSALDRKIRGNMQRELQRIHRATGLTTIMVTHDQEEAMFLGDSVLMLDAGRVQQSGHPTHLYLEPANPFVADFLGAALIGSGTIVREAGGKGVAVGDAVFSVPDSAPAVGEEVVAAVMAESVSVAPADRVTAAGEHVGRLHTIDYFGPFARVTVGIGGVTVPATVSPHEARELTLGADVLVRIAPGGLHVFASARQT